MEASAEIRGVAPDDRVVITDVTMPFGSMVVFIVKWALASIPAIIVLTIIFAMLGVLFGGLLGGLFTEVLGQL